jgi:predicted ester cyclase
MSTSHERTTTDSRELCLRSIDIMATGEIADFEAVFHVQAGNQEASHEPPDCRVGGPAAFHATALWLRAAYADLRWDINEVVVDGDLVVVHATMSGRHTGTFVTYLPDGAVDAAMPPTGKPFSVTQTHWFRVADGKVIDHWANRDDLTLARQVGWVPPTPPFLVRMALAKRRARRASA